MAQVDRRAAHGYGIGLIQIMELAGRNLAEEARQMLGGSVAGRMVVVLCGTGNNGGGGMAAARNLHGWGARVQVVLTGSEAALKTVPRRQWRIIRRLGLAVSPKGGTRSGRPDMVIDAIFGYGFRGKPRQRAARWIEWANSQGCPVLALDLPSGLDATTGIPAIPCVHATATLTLALPKTGLQAPQAQAFVGEVQTKPQRTFYDSIVIGAGPAGLTAALYLAREGLDALVVEKSGLGGQAGATQRVDNFPGFDEGVGGVEFGERLAHQARRSGVEILQTQQVADISADGTYLCVTTGKGDLFQTRAVLLATGARYRKLGVPGEDELVGLNIHFCATCDGAFYKGKEVLVINGGNSGFQEGLMLTKASRDPG